MKEPSVTRSLRLPLSLDTRVQELADKRGLSVNAWIVRALTSDVQPKKSLTQVVDVDNKARAGDPLPLRRW